MVITASFPVAMIHTVTLAYSDKGTIPSGRHGFRHRVTEAGTEGWLVRLHPHSGSLKKVGLDYEAQGLPPSTHFFPNTCANTGACRGHLTFKQQFQILQGHSRSTSNKVLGQDLEGEGVLLETQLLEPQFVGKGRRGCLLQLGRGWLGQDRREVKGS